MARFVCLFVFFLLYSIFPTRKKKKKRKENRQKNKLIFTKCRYSIIPERLKDHSCISSLLKFPSFSFLYPS